MALPLNEDEDEEGDDTGSNTIVVMMMGICSKTGPHLFAVIAATRNCCCEASGKVITGYICNASLLD